MKIMQFEMELVIAPVFRAGDRVVGTPEKAIKAIVDSDDFDLWGSYYAVIEDAHTVKKIYGVFWDDDLVRVCETEDDANVVIEKFREAERKIKELEYGQSESILEIFNQVNFG